MKLQEEWVGRIYRSGRNHRFEIVVGRRGGIELRENLALLPDDREEASVSFYLGQFLPEKFGHLGSLFELKELLVDFCDMALKDPQMATAAKRGIESLVEEKVKG